MKARKVLAMFFAGCLALASCATTNSDGTPLTVNQRIGRCVAMVAVGAVLGAVIGNNSGGGNAGQGAAIGGAVGLGACAVWLAFQSEQDQARIQQLQMQAAQSGQPSYGAWRSSTNQPLAATVTPSTETSVTAQNGETRLCRTLNTRAEAGGRAEAMSEVWCRQADGTYAPVTR